ncbi:MAG: outer membrane beta-barrel protein, partial [Acidobacteriaceae bacterium]|nr:outer membrane beta-barrel protein [Acidobacteriaceae bacterium]
MRSWYSKVAAGKVSTLMKNVGVHHALIVALALTPLLCNGQTEASNSTPSERSHPTTITEPFTPTQTNVAVIERVTELEQEVAHLRQELRATQTNGIGAFSLRTAVYSPSDATPASADPAAAPAAKPAAPQAPDPLSGFSSVLGGATVVGLVDGYYSYNFNHPSAASSALSGTPGNFSSLRLFDARNNQFALNLVELGLVKAPDADQRLGYKAIFGFGDAMQQVNVISGGDPGFLQYLKEAYLSYLAPAGKGLQIDVGKFVTPNGAEVIESNGNWNYSRSLLFNYAIPFYHYGIRAQYTFSPKFALTGYVVNGWNDVIHDTSTAYYNSGKTGGLTFAWTATKKLTVTDNWMGGPGA